MAADDQTNPKAPPPTQLTTPFRWSTRRKTILRRRKPPTIRLGSGKKHKRGFSLARILRRIKLRWLKLQYTCMLRKLKEYYRNLIKDIAEAGSTIETFQQRFLMETSFAVPVMGVSFNSFPSATGSNRPSALFM
ncbi:hypothetical protein SLEP1_g21251 [Rubroshorea leprosula]|uniref:Uncharacterized protein n=1 Tax=Rubroshorea leprosula TaxID=152421 RepID=A0AAV5JBG4_9ROSI|nr:hypothetical protein SLEP1_g21251 [Rubroshorea leprosula]